MGTCLRVLFLDMRPKYSRVCCVRIPKVFWSISSVRSGPNGEVAERLKAPASKAGNGVPSFVGSNPTLSASILTTVRCSTPAAAHLSLPAR